MWARSIGADEKPRSRGGAMTCFISASQNLPSPTTIAHTHLPAAEQNTHTNGHTTERDRDAAAGGAAAAADVPRHAVREQQHAEPVRVSLRARFIPAPCAHPTHEPAPAAHEPTCAHPEPGAHDEPGVPEIETRRGADAAVACEPEDARAGGVCAEGADCCAGSCRAAAADGEHDWHDYWKAAR